MRKQKELPGIEKETIGEIDDAAETYQAAKKKRMKLTEKEVEAKDALIAVMKKHKRTAYRDEKVNPPLTVILKPGKDGVKVSEEGGEDEGEEGEEDGTDDKH